jgi:FkbM family methyltransferase
MITAERVGKWLKRPLGHKILSIASHTKRIFFRAVGGVLFLPFVRFFTNTRPGRFIFYKYQPAQTLLIAQTQAGKFVVNSSDKVIGCSTFVNQIPFDSEKLAEVIGLLKVEGEEWSGRIELLIDIGANIGTIGLSAVSAGVVKKCIAFEPEPNNFSLLQANIAINSLSNRVTAHNVALSDGSVTELEFELDGVNYGDHRVRISKEQGLFNELSRTVIKVKAAQLSDFQNDIDPKTSIIWMDTQGFEGYVLSGAIPLIEKKIPIVTEFWPYGLKRSNCFEKFLDALDSGNYKFVVTLNGDNISKAYQRQTLLDLANSIGWEGRHTDLLIY